MAGAEAAYRRADEGGDAAGAFNLGRLLGDWGDLVGAEAAFRRADERGDTGAAFHLGGLLAERQDFEAPKRPSARLTRVATAPVPRTSGCCSSSAAI